MNYEKKYKEAVEKIRNLLDEGKKNGNTIVAYEKDFESIFPELIESEDEKIRKELIDIVAKSPITFAFEDKGKVLAWLEKQGEPSIKWNKNTEGNKPQVNHSVLMKTIHGIAEGEWKGEYWEQYRWAGVVRDSDVLSWMELSDLDKQGEQKPAWSCEDETRLQACIDTLQAKSLMGKVDTVMTNWLKSLKQRIKGE